MMSATVVTANYPEEVKCHCTDGCGFFQEVGLQQTKSRKGEAFQVYLRNR